MEMEKSQFSHHSSKDKLFICSTISHNSLNFTTGSLPLNSWLVPLRQHKRGTLQQDCKTPGPVSILSYYTHECILSTAFSAKNVFIVFFLL